MAEYRPIAPGDYEQYRRFVSYGFAAERGPLEAPDDQYFETELFEPRGVYDGGLVSGCKRYDIEAYVRDGVEQIDGVELRRSTESRLLDLVDDPDIGTLTQLYVGRYDPDTAERVAGLTLLTDSVREPLAAVFPRRQVCLREFF